MNQSYSKYKGVINHTDYDSLVQHTEYDQFIGVFHNVVPQALCDNLIQLVDNPDSPTDYERNFGPYRTDVVAYYVFNPWALTPIKNLKTAVSFCLFHYGTKYASITQNSIYNPSVKIQRTDIGGGFHNWHHETDRNEERIGTWMLYLNDLDPDDGTTEFIFQSKKITPSAGTLLIWPAGYTHSHRGNPPYKKNKYVATGWFLKTTDEDNRREKWII
jgi:hypothetical protein